MWPTQACLGFPLSPPENECRGKQPFPQKRLLKHHLCGAIFWRPASQLWSCQPEASLEERAFISRSPKYIFPQWGTHARSANFSASHPPIQGFTQQSGSFSSELPSRQFPSMKESIFNSNSVANECAAFVFPQHSMLTPAGPSQCCDLLFFFKYAFPE